MMKKFLSPFIRRPNSSLRGRFDRVSYIILGLGNPGPKYSCTRHNVGFWCVDRLSKEYSTSVCTGDQAALLGECSISSTRIVLAKPSTFVNHSGRAASNLMSRYNLPSQNLLVIYDDIHLPVGKIRLRANGSAGGHNGMKSIIESIGTRNFPRLRVGIGGPPRSLSQSDHVLGSMSLEDQNLTDEAIELVVQVVSSFIGEGITLTMNKFN